MGFRDTVEEVALVSVWKRGGKERGETGLEEGFEPRQPGDGLCCLRKWDTGGKLVPGTAMSLAREFKDLSQEVPVGSSWIMKARPGMDLGWTWDGERKAVRGRNTPVGGGGRALSLGHWLWHFSLLPSSDVSFFIHKMGWG